MGPDEAIRPLLAAPGALLRAAQRVERELLAVPVETQPAERPRPLEGAAVVFHALQERALQQSSRDAEESLALAILRLLVPDEARLLVALDHVGWAPAVDVSGRDGNAGVTGASLLGRQAGAALVDRTPVYLARLTSFGLVEAVDERPGREQEYEILLAEPVVLRALRSGRRAGRGPRVRRYAVDLTELGRMVLRVGAAGTPP